MMLKLSNAPLIIEKIQNFAKIAQNFTYLKNWKFFGINLNLNFLDQQLPTASAL